jgi:hypothetical protein
MQKTSRDIRVLLLFWILLFVLYYPAAKAGFVDDFTGWLDNIRNTGFWDYINRKHFAVNSLYQFTQLTTYIFYRLFGANPWLWHLLHLTLHAVNCYLWYLLCNRIFTDSGIHKAQTFAFTGAFLFCISPYMSEVIVWEPSYHYLQGFLLILLILHWVQKFHHNSKIKYALWSAVVFFLSTYSLEIFYLTPCFVLIFALYYRIVLKYDKAIFKKAILCFLIPQLVLFALYFVVYRSCYGQWLPHLKVEATQNPYEYYLSKPAKYLFQLALLGRYFPFDIKIKIYHLLDKSSTIFATITALFAILCFIGLRFKTFNSNGKAISLLFISIAPILIIMSPLWFPVIQNYVSYDRYLYLLAAFIYMLLCLLLGSFFRPKALIAMVSIYSVFSIYFTFKTNLYWQASADMIHNLLFDFPNTNGKTTILLNIPENLQGIPMMDATPEGEYALEHNEFVPEKIYSKIYDGAAFNMGSIHDGAHIKVLNDSTIGVTLNQWGTWWWYNAQGAGSYSNTDYSINMIDAGHYYELTVKRPNDNYMLLFMNNGKWKPVDWTKTNIDQY